MIVEDFLIQAATHSAISEQSVIFSYLNNAAQELWAAVDFPNVLQEKKFKPYDTQNAFVSLPHYVHAVRGVVPCSGMTTDVMDKTAAFKDDYYHSSPWMWRMIEKTPLIANITEASQLTISRVDPKATDEFIVTIGGKTDVAEDIKELVIFSPNDATKQTENAYEDLSVLAKNIATSCNLDVYDAAGNRVAFLPNNYFEVWNTIIQIVDRCSYQVCSGSCHCVQVLYKPVLPPFTGVTDSIPQGIEQGLLFKFREWLDLSTEDKIERAQVMSAKSTALIERAAYDLDKGKVKPMNIRRSVFTPTAGIGL